jgi:asparagine synthase (glutamine-hydrolysing)
MKVLDEKYILKRAAGHLLPPTVKQRPKQPYRAPDAKGFFAARGGIETHNYVRDLLSRERIQKHGLFNVAAVQSLVEKASKGLVVGTKDNMAIVGILSTQLFMEQFIADLGRYN